MEILKFPHSNLLKKCEEVLDFGPKLEGTLDEMWNIMIKYGGMGLAHNQVGGNLRMFVMSGPKHEKLYIINSSIIEKSKVPANLKEGCLSMPGEFLSIPDRSSWVYVKFQDQYGKFYDRVFYGIHSVCVQHECQHLDGEIFFESKSVPRKIKKDIKRKYKLK